MDGVPFCDDEEFVLARVKLKERHVGNEKLTKEQEMAVFKLLGIVLCVLIFAIGSKNWAQFFEAVLGLILIIGLLTLVGKLLDRM